MVLMPLLSRLLTLLVILTMPLFVARLTLIPIKSLSICFRVIGISITPILKRRGCLTAPRLTIMSLIKMMLVMVSVAAISKTFGLLRFLLTLSFLAKCRLLPHLLTLWVCKLLMLICILTKNVITSCSVTMMLFLHLEVKPHDADNRPLLVMRSNLWASGYDVDGTDQTSLGQFSGRVQQTYKHSVPRFFVPEHGTMFTLALVRFPPTATKEIQYLNAKGALTYTDIAGDPVLYGNLPPREISMKDVFRSGDSSKKFKIAEGQWYRYAPSYVSPAYHLLEGFPFIQEPPSGDLQERVLIRHQDYDQCFQSVQLLQWNSQVKFNVTVYRNLPTTRDSIMTT